MGIRAAGETHVTILLPPPGEASRITRVLQDYPGWSASWDKKHGVWRVAEDDSDLYAESADAATVIGYIKDIERAAHVTSG